jgi:hypothetical protein
VSLWDDPETAADADRDGDSGEDGDRDRAPICPACGVTALPGELAHVIDTTFVCDNPDCESFGDTVA